MGRQSVTTGLHPPVLRELGLEAALRGLAAGMQQDHALPVEVQHRGTQLVLEERAGSFVFRAVRELLTNVVRHAQAAVATVSVCSGDGELSVCVEDDGIGFDGPPGDSWLHGQGGFGLFSIRERAEDFGGRLEIHSEPGSGTKVTLTVPLDLDE